MADATQLPDGIVEGIAIFGADAADRCSHHRVLWDLPLVKRAEEHRRLVHILHRDLDRRPVSELVQGQEAGVRVIVGRLGCHHETALRLEIQRLKD